MIYVALSYFISVPCFIFIFTYIHCFSFHVMFFFSFQKCKFFLGNGEHTMSYTIPKLYTLYPLQTGNGWLPQNRLTHLPTHSF